MVMLERAVRLVTEHPDTRAAGVVGERGDVPGIRVSGREVSGDGDQQTLPERRRPLVPDQRDLAADKKQGRGRPSTTLGRSVGTEDGGPGR
jgi:hypothetical protein